MTLYSRADITGNERRSPWVYVADTSFRRQEGLPDIYSVNPSSLADKETRNGRPSKADFRPACNVESWLKPGRRINQKTGTHFIPALRDMGLHG